MRVLNEQDKKTYKNVWTIAEITDNAVHPVSYELLGAAKKLALQRGCEVFSVVLGALQTELLKTLFACGADKIIFVNDEKLSHFNDELECNLLERLINKYRPETVLFAATSRGRALAPRLAGKIYTGLTADCTGLSTDTENGDLLQTRPAFGGNIMATISRWRPCVPR